MSWASAIRQLPLRLSLGVFFLNSGVSKLSADEEKAASLHGFAAGTYPFLSAIESGIFVKALAVGELALGTALIVPLVPGLLAGAGLTTFALGTVGLYLNTPGMREEGGIRPTEQGIPLAKDFWMVGAGLTMMIDDLIERAQGRC
jgi:uncharacterized membrane protein YphA (DoxX/SURF4 family)